MLKIRENKIYDFIEEGGWIIRHYNHRFQVYEVPLYGGEERYLKTFNSLIDALSFTEKLT